MNHIESFDPELWGAIRNEIIRQHDHLELIASENYTSRAVLEATGSVLTNKYAEGYPGRRYYGGCEFVDVVENIARDRAKKLFNADHVNVQPHSGSQANMGVLFSLLEPGDTILGMDLAHGGHLTHGAPVSFSGRLYTAIRYGVSKELETIDYDQVERLAREHRPKLIIAGASSYPRTIDFARFRQIADEVGAYFLADMAHIAGLVATGFHPSPVKLADFTTTTTHKTLRGPRGGMILVGNDAINDRGIKTFKGDGQKRWSEVIDSMIMPGIQGGPLMHSIAAKAVAFKEALDPGFSEYIGRVLANAKTLAKSLAEGGCRIVSGGTDNHLILVDLSPMEITGKDAEKWLEGAGITTNKNAIPFDQKGPFVTSGIRVGTAAITTRGMGRSEMEKIADLIMEILASNGDQQTQVRVRGEVEALTAGFPTV